MGESGASRGRSIDAGGWSIEDGKLGLRARTAPDDTALDDTALDDTAPSEATKPRRERDTVLPGEEAVSA
ncbi:MAG: hypothetical protein AAGD38_03195 [Acidobacteriota bacterium]